MTACDGPEAPHMGRTPADSRIDRSRPGPEPPAGGVCYCVSNCLGHERRRLARVVIERNDMVGEIARRGREVELSGLNPLIGKQLLRGQRIQHWLQGTAAIDQLVLPSRETSRSCGP